MKLVTKDNLENWAKTTFSKSNLPYLISRLVRATTPNNTKADFPSGSSTFIGGWDGIVSCEVETAYVPQGISLWEFGTTDDCKGKADDDYDKRKKDPLEFNPSECTFIFITPRVWTKKNKWIKAKKTENYWKDVLVYDAIDIEQWLDNALSVSRWFASQDGVDSYPFDGIMTADEFWEEWSIGGKKLVLLPECVISGRDYEKNQLLSTLQGEPTIKGVKASSKNEAIAFIIASAKTFPIEEADRFFSKSLIVDTEGNFRGIRINTNSPLNLIPRFEDAQPLYSAVSKGHHVLVPLGADDEFNQETIILPIIDKYGQIKSLVDSGISENEAEKFSREAGRNITILKKLLGFPYTKAKWMENENIREIIPALIIGRWNESFVGDVELIEKLSGQNYSEYAVTLNKWKNLEESPIIQIGETWRLTSPLDLWTNLSSSLIPKDLEYLQECFELAFKSGNPPIEPEDKNSYSAYFSKSKKYSNWSREGLVQSLILIGRLNEVKIPNLKNPQSFVDALIFDLLDNTSGEMWISLDHELPLIAEASPESFLKAVKKSLAKEQPEIMDMFTEEDGIFDKTSHHTGLLWALESLAWLPEHLLNSSFILLTLSRLDPGGRLLNRPLNSISEIFKPWYYQTLALFDDRMEVLKYITEKERESGWALLINMLPDRRGVAHPTHKMRWRMFDKNTNLVYTYEEIWKTHSEVIEMLISIFDNDELKFAQLIEEIPNLSPKDRKRVLEWAENTYQNVKQINFSSWESIRKILNQHRSHPDTNRALPESELAKLETFYHKLQPTDAIDKYIWLFNDHWPNFPEGFKYVENDYKEGHIQQQNRINTEREKAIIIFRREIGLNETLGLRKKVKQPGALGSALAGIIFTQDEVLKVCECLYDDKNTIGFIHNFIYQKTLHENFNWVKSLVLDLQEHDYSNKAISNALIPLNQNQQLWDFIASLNEEIENEYWKNVNPNFYGVSDREKTFGIGKLLKYKRFFSAIDVCNYFIDELPSNLISETLFKAGTEESNETPRFKGYVIERIFEELDKRNDIDKSTLIKLEWLFLPLLDSYGTRRNPILLEEELTNNPEFFIEILKWVYLPKDKVVLEKERKGISDDFIQNRAKQAYHLLHSWKKIPGMKEDKSIDAPTLHEWVSKVRQLAKTVDRLDVADSEIGKILAQYPENLSQWPQEVIFQVIEDVNTRSIKSGYSTAMFNKRGSTSRGPYDGGNIERANARNFEKLETDFKYKYPNVAEIFKHMKQRYLEDAKREDEEAQRNKLEY
ncbi:hypothetical protein [Sphingobacterium sp.]|uniref:hypothetical protein n=1 Tax=Sphingobacterium sp. TaxID=341027 RepID=UPI0031E2DAEC